MASSFSVTKMVDGSRDTVIKVDITGDTSSELTLAKIFDVTQYVNTGVHKRIKKIQYCLNGFAGQLYWEGTSNIPLLTMEKDKHSSACFFREGCINNSGVTAPTGCIFLTTVGLTVKLTGYIILTIQSKDLVDGVR
jgi:hypothetical protein